MEKMVTILFHETVFGPIHSRRLGTSLGINLMPNDGKICSFDCLYCEAGYNDQGAGHAGISSREEVKDTLEKKLSAMKAIQPVRSLSIANCIRKSFFHRFFPIPWKQIAHSLEVSF